MICENTGSIHSITGRHDAQFTVFANAFEGERWNLNFLGKGAKYQS
jgi:hypothetical protein